eukprot:8235557-Lingulodinium_polyedra.AAC.1
MPRKLAVVGVLRATHRWAHWCRDCASAGLNPSSGTTLDLPPPPQLLLNAAPQLNRDSHTTATL